VSVVPAGVAPQARIAIFQRRLKSLAHEMSRTLYRTTRSSLFSNGDFAVGFLDARGRMLEQDEHLPMMAFSLFPGCQYLIDFFGDDIADGEEPQALAGGEHDRDEFLQARERGVETDQERDQ